MDGPGHQLLDFPGAGGDVSFSRVERHVSREIDLAAGMTAMNRSFNPTPRGSVTTSIPWNSIRGFLWSQSMSSLVPWA
jgi:hypothetical protein